MIEKNCQSCQKNYDKVEWGEKCHHASDILFEWPHPNCLENLSVLML